MNQTDLDFTAPTLTPQSKRLLDRLMIAPLTNAQMRDDLRLLSYTRRLSDLREAGYHIKKEYIGDGLFRYSLVEQIVNVKLNSATSKDGEKNGKTYTVYTIFDENGEKYGTFDTNDTGAIVAIKYVVGKFGNKITGMELSQEQAA